MSLERDLASLAGAVEWPETPDIAGALAGRLEPRAARRRRRPGRRAVAVGLALLAGAAAAVPDVRAAVGDLLRFAGGERIERVEEPRGATARLDLGAPVTLADAGRRAGFAIGVPAATRIAGVRLGGALGDRTVSLLLPGGAILSQRPARATPFVAKQVGPGVEVRPLVVDGAEAVWVARGPRTLVVGRPDGTEEAWDAALPGSAVLLWDRRDGVALRLETRDGLNAALRLARSVR